MTILSILAFLLTTAGIVILLDLTPERITTDIMQFISPKQSLRDKARTTQGKKKTLKLTQELMNIQKALEETGNGSKFAFVCTASLVFLVAGIVMALAIDNLFVAPILGVGCCLVPFLYAKSITSYYEKHVDLELESTLSMITTAYIRSDNIVIAVEDNLSYIRPPLNEIFRSFVGETRLINADTKAALLRLRGKVHNTIFEEWCDALIQCQDDRTLKDTLHPIVAKLTDVRIVNNEMNTLIQSARVEYYAMVALVVCNIPLLYILNQEWYNTLMHTVAGKIVIAICALVILVTGGFMLKYTKPIKYTR